MSDLEYRVPDYTAWQAEAEELLTQAQTTGRERTFARRILALIEHLEVRQAPTPDGPETAGR